MIAVKMTSEEELLFLCARLELSPDQQEHLAEILRLGGLDWEALLYKAGWHRLSGLVFRHLRNPDNAWHVPEKVLARLKASYISNAARILFFQSELRKALEVFREHGIEAIPLKGTALLETVFKDPGLRPMGDIDLLVRHEYAGAADSLIQKMGYKPGGDEQLQSELKSNDRQLAALIGENTPVVFEVHPHIVDIASPWRFDIEKFWAQSRPADVAGVPSRVLSPEDQIISLTVNFFRHRMFASYSAIGQMCDIAEVARGRAGDVNWQNLVCQVECTSLSGPMFYGLYLASCLLEAPVPSSVLESLKPANFRPKDVELFVQHRVLKSRGIVKALVTPHARYRWWTVANSMLRRAFPSKRNLAYSYNVPVQSGRMYRLYFQRWGELLQILARSIARPNELYRDVSVDRWLHSLYKP